MSINFYGKAERLTDAGIWRAAEFLGLERAAKLRAVMKVESLNSMFRKDGRPPILCEGHIFYRNLRARSAITLFGMALRPDVGPEPCLSHSVAAVERPWWCPKEPIENNQIALLA